MLNLDTLLKIDICDRARENLTEVGNVDFDIPTLTARTAIFVVFFFVFFTHKVWIPFKNVAA